VYTSFPKEEQWGVKSRAGFAQALLGSCPSCSEAGKGEADGTVGQGGSVVRISGG